MVKLINMVFETDKASKQEAKEIWEQIKNRDMESYFKGGPVSRLTVTHLLALVADEIG